MSTSDVIVIGAGHNGLITAAYLARAGLEVLVVERNREIGGGTTTDEVTLPGYRHNLHANFHIGVTDSPWYRDLELHRYGLAYVIPPVQQGTTFPDQRCLIVHRDPQRTAMSFARFSQRDAETYLQLYERYARRLRPFMLAWTFSPPLPHDQLMSVLSGDDGREFAAFMDMTMNQAIEGAFESEQVRNLLKIWLHAMTVENMPGTGLFLPIAMSSMGLASLAVGGSISLPRALGRLVEAHGGSVVTDATVREIPIRDGRATGVILDDGRRFEARRYVVSAIDAPQTMELVGRQNLPATVVQKLDRWQWGAHTTVTVHVALNEPPRYASAGFDPDIDRAFNIVMSPLTGAEIDEAFAEVDRGDLPSRPFGNGACDSLFDPSYAPAGKHSAFWWPWARYDLREGGPQAWDDVRDEMTERLLDTWREFAPNLHRGNVLASYLFTPLDYERRNLNMVRGGMRIGAYYADQIGIERPHPLLSSGRTPIEGLFLAGSSTGAGGGVSGAPGYVAANQIAEDAGLREAWRPIDRPEVVVERLMSRVAS